MKRDEGVFIDNKDDLITDEVKRSRTLDCTESKEEIQEGDFAGVKLSQA